MTAEGYLSTIDALVGQRYGLTIVSKSPGGLFEEVRQVVEEGVWVT